MLRHIALLIALLAAPAASAQVFPDNHTTTVNDFADMLDGETEARLTDQLDALAAETGVELTIATLSSVRFYANDLSIEAYARQLFDSWQVGDAEANDGILLMVFRDDRELWIELGAGYGAGYDSAVQGVIDREILPAFRQDNFPAGIEAGATGLIEHVVTPYRTGGSTPSETAGDGGGIGIGAILAAIVAAIAGLIGWSKYKRATRKCASCGKTGLTFENVVLKEATEAATGAGERRVTCPHCGHMETESYTIAKKTAEKDEKEFGGGKSGGGGAGGKW